MGNKLTTSNLTDYRAWVTARLIAEPNENAATMETALEAYDLTLRDARLKHALENYVGQINTGYQVGGGLIETPVISVAGTDSYEVDDVIVVTDSAGNGYDGSVTVEGIDTDTVVVITFATPGTLYEIDDNVVIGTDGAGTGATAKVSAVGAGGEIEGIEITDPGAGYLSTDSNTAVPDESTGSGAVCTVVIGEGGIATVQILDGGHEYATPVLDATGEGDGLAELTISATSLTDVNNGAKLNTIIAGL
jgi:hypothetical protein